ncbi:MAG: T9SS type A sorting domain-containing protein [Flavobacteriales bacterium]|nr:T9SS type A sorting domain-containing protein [Flavobacteriales bacterium]
MKRLKLILSATIISALSLNAYSQVDLSEPDRINCGTAVINNQRLAQNPFLQSLKEEQEKQAKEYWKNHIANKGGAISYTIPVVYHIIHNNGPENVSKATIEASIANLNEDFQKLNSDLSQVVASFIGIAADIEIQFRLAHIDPNGNCTEGITRTVSTQTYAMTENAKSLVNWNTTKYLNIWVGQTMASGSGGWSYYPGWAPSQSQEGIVIRSAQLTNSITHEVGHFLALPHTWGSSNTPGIASNCGLDDGIGDTPTTIGNSGTCNTSSVTCSSLDNVQNYMDYATCTRMFTEGQKNQMWSALNSSNGARNNLWSNANLIATGTKNPYGAVTCAPIADFSYNKEYVCEGASVTFTDDSYNAVPTGWNWIFTGGTPSTSGSSNPTITYNTAGVYSVTHQPSTSAGSGNLTKSSIITVSTMVADYIGPIVDGFENTTQFNNDWWVNNDGGQTWSSNSSAATTGARSVRVRNYFTSNDNELDELISPSFDISTTTTKTMTFMQAFAKKTSGDSDKLLVYYSTDCGGTWFLKLPLTAGNLATAPNHSNVFVPTSSEWVQRSVSLTSIGTSTNVRFKFAFTSGGGNDIYIDDVNIGGTVGIEDFSSVASFNMYPNPTNSSAQISFNLTKDINSLSIKVRNAVGQVVTNVINGQSFNAGKYTLKIDEERKLSSGIYFVEFNADNNIKVQKLIVQ